MDGCLFDLVFFFARDLLEGNSENTNIALPKDGRPNMPHNQTPKSAILFRLVIKVFAIWQTLTNMWQNCRYPLAEFDKLCDIFVENIVNVCHNLLRQFATPTPARSGAKYVYLIDIEKVAT